MVQDRAIVTMTNQ